MRRTYRSKKETAGALYHRDVIQNLDEKSSAFDAFYIQNIKQTKRELSCVGPSTGFGVASNKVRKRKYVKKIVEPKIKKVEDQPCTAIMSTSTYLTPDKSIRVNKILDPFDMLLNSSSHCQDPYKSPALQTLLAKKPGKTYTKKKFNYSSDTSAESDKENTSTAQSNITDIRSHELVIEKLLGSPKTCDESLNRIVKNISLFSKLKQKTANNSFNTSYKYRNRLTNGCHSPILQKSPLCSTPFKEKYRGKSIYAYSPITFKVKDSPNDDLITEENNESSTSIIFPCKEKYIKDMSPKFIDTGPFVKIQEEKSKIYDDIEIMNASETEVILHLKPSDEQSLMYDNIDEIISVQCNYSDRIDHSSTQSHAEPFCGFSTINDYEAASKKKQNYLMKIIQDCKENDGNKHISCGFSEGFSLHDEDSNAENIEDIDKNENSNKSLSAELSIISKEFSNSDHDASISLYSDNDSMYDTCNSEDVSEDLINSEPKVNIEKLNDSVFLKYYEKMLENQNSSSDVSDADNYEESNVCHETNNADNSKTSLDDFKDDDFSHNCSKTDKINEIENLSIRNQTSVYISDTSTNEDIIESNTNNDDIHISFVTTRRRVVNDSMFIFNNSNESITDFDKTVLSNKTTLSNNTSDSESDVATIDVSLINASNNRNAEVVNERKIYRRSTRLTQSTTRPKSDSNELAANMPQVIDNSSDDDANKDGFNQKQLLKHSMSLVTTINNSGIFEDSLIPERCSSINAESKPSIVLRPGKKWERSLSIYRRMTTTADNFENCILEEDETQKKGRNYRQSVISTMEMQDSPHNDSINSRRSTFISKPSRSTIRFVKDSNNSRISLNTTEVFDDLKGFLTEECDDTVIELSKLSISESEFEITVLDKFDESSERIATARDYVLRRCNQTDPLSFDECYPETLLKNCHKIGEGVYGEVFLLRGRDGRPRVMKIVPIAGTVKVNGETQKDFHEVISEIVIAMELSALRAPIAEIDRYFDEGKDVALLDLHSVENATDVFNEVLAVRCVQGPYPSRLLDLWELFDECKGSDNDSPAALPTDQQYMVLELANAGQDLESYQFTGAQQAHALFQQIAFGLAVGEESFQFEHRDLHWGNVLIAPTEQKVATFVLNGRTYRVARGGVAATIIDYSLSRVTLPLASSRAALYNDLAADEQLFEAVGDYQFQVYRLMRDKLGNDWKNFEPYTNILWLHYTVDKMITALRYKRTNTKIHKHYIDKLKGIKERILAYKSATEYVQTDIEI